MKISRAIVLLAALALAGCGHPLQQTSTADLIRIVSGIDESDLVLFRGEVSFRQNQMNAVGALTPVSVLLVTKGHLVVIDFDHKNRRAFRSFQAKRSDINHTADEQMRFVRIEMNDGRSHWIDVLGGRKADLLQVLRGDPESL